MHGQAAALVLDVLPEFTVIKIEAARRIATGAARQHAGSQGCITGTVSRPTSLEFRTPKEIEMPHEKYTECIEACGDCAVACNHCAASCLKERDVKMMARCIALDTDCRGDLPTGRSGNGQGQRIRDGDLQALCGHLSSLWRRMRNAQSAALPRLRGGVPQVC
jgi:ferredoxin